MQITNKLLFYYKYYCKTLITFYKNINVQESKIYHHLKVLFIN